MALTCPLDFDVATLRTEIQILKRSEPLLDDRLH
jgi:hypothetical protein